MFTRIFQSPKNLAYRGLPVQLVLVIGAVPNSFLTSMDSSRGLSRKIREIFVKYSQNICEIFVKNLRNIHKIFAKISQKNQEKFKLAKFSPIFHEFFANFARILIFCEYFANFS